MSEPYWTDGTCSLYLGDCREILPALDVAADLVVADPPYGETALVWDRWVTGWPNTVAGVARSLWCFGSLRMFLDRRDEFDGWKLSQDLIVEKSNGAGAVTDRFRRVHEHALHWYRGPWRDIHHDVPRVAAPPDKIARNGGTARRTYADHLGTYGTAQAWTDNGTRLMRSVLKVKSMRGRAVHPTEKAVDGLLEHLVTYACPPGGLVVDPFAGSGSTLDAARRKGRRAAAVADDIGGAVTDQSEGTWTDTDRAMFVDQARAAMTAADARSARLIEMRDVIEKVVDRSACPVPTHDPLVTELTAAVMGRVEQVADDRERQVRAERNQLRRELDQLLAGDTLLRDSIAEAKRQFPGAHLDFNLTGNLCVIWLDVYVAWIDVVGSGGLTVFPGARGVVQPTGTARTETRWSTPSTNWSPSSNDVRKVGDERPADHL